MFDSSPTRSLLASRYCLTSDSAAGALAGGSSPKRTCPVTKLAEQSAAAQSALVRRRAMRRDRAIPTIASPPQSEWPAHTKAARTLVLFSGYRGDCRGVLEKM